MAVNAQNEGKQSDNGNYARRDDNDNGNGHAHRSQKTVKGTGLGSTILGALDLLAV